MEITRAPALDYLVSVNRPAPGAIADGPSATNQPNPLAASESPAAIVTLSPRAEPPPVYPEPTVVVSYLRNNNLTGPAAAAASQALLHSLNQVSEKKIPFTVSNLFSHVGALSRETSEYRNEVRQFRIPQKVATDKFSPEFSGSAGTRAESAFLTITTRDGDSIQIQFSRNKSPDGTSQMEFSFVVDGELSEAEQKALEQLAGKLGAIGDEFFRTDTAELRGLKDIDTDAIGYFKLTLQRFDPGTDSYVEHSYEFSIDKVTQTQSLIAEDVNGYSVDIKSQLQTLTGNKGLEPELIQQYIDLINRAADDSDTPNASKRFMLDAFESMFADFLAPVNAEVVQEQDQAEKSLAAFDSGMPDFNASFRSPVLHNPGFYSQVAAMVLTLEQKTLIEQNGEDLLIKQESRYEFTNSHFESFPKEYLEHLGGNYTYTTERETGNSSRILSMTNERVNNILIEQEFSRGKESSQFVNYALADQDTYSYADRRAREYAELLTKLNSNKQQSAVDALLESSKDKLFLTI